MVFRGRRWIAANVIAELGLTGAVLLVAFVAVSCSSGDDSVGSEGDAPAVSEPTDTIEATVFEDELELSAGSDSQEGEVDDASSEFIDLPYWEGFLAEGFSITGQPEAECARPEPDVTVCEFELIGSMVATHIGHATEIQTGTRTSYWSETCGPEGSDTMRVVQDGTGTITSRWGDTLNFRVRQTCLLTNWVAEGGTGRFEDASGRMSGVVGPQIPGFLAVNAGTLTVKAELWEDYLPPPAD